MRDEFLAVKGKKECVLYMHCLKTDGRPTVHGLLLAPTSIMEMLPYIQDGTSPHWRRRIVAALFRWMYHWWFIDLLGYTNFRLCPQWKSRFQWRVFLMQKRPNVVLDGVQVSTLDFCPAFAIDAPAPALTRTSEAVQDIILSLWLGKIMLEFCVAVAHVFPYSWMWLLQRFSVSMNGLYT